MWGLVIYDNSKINIMNWSNTNYVIEGNSNDLEEIKNVLEEVSSLKWPILIDILKKLNINVERSNSVRGYLIPPVDYSDGVIKLFAREAWGVSDFADYLKEKYPSLKCYFESYDFSIGLFETNDINHKYFKNIYVANYADYEKKDYEDAVLFTSEESLFKWLSEKINKEIKTKEDFEKIDFSSYNDYNHSLSVEPIRYFNSNLLD